MATPQEVAQWMHAELQRSNGYLYQETVVYEIERLFGREHTYDNEGGNLAIARPVLNAFRKLTEATVVWERGERMWRYRAAHDAPGRQAE